MTFLKLFFEFFKIGLFTFGGGYAMISQIKEAVVEKKKWLSDDELMEIITIAESTPGPIAINLATFVGYKRKGVKGSIAATLGVILPSFIILYIISLFLDSFMEMSTEEVHKVLYNVDNLRVYAIAVAICNCAVFHCELAFTDIYCSF